MSTEETLSLLRAINEEKHRVQIYLETLARYKNKPIDQVAIITPEGESQTFLVTPAIMQLMMDDLDRHFQRRNLELTSKAESFIAPKEYDEEAEKDSIETQQPETH